MGRGRLFRCAQLELAPTYECISEGPCRSLLDHRSAAAIGDRRVSGTGAVTVVDEEYQQKRILLSPWRLCRKSRNLHKYHSERQRRISRLVLLSKTRSFGYRLRMTSPHSLVGERKLYSPSDMVMA